MPARIFNAAGAPLTWAMLSLCPGASCVFFSPAQYAAVSNLLGYVLFDMGLKRDAVEQQKYQPPFRSIILDGTPYFMDSALEADEIAFTTAVVGGFILTGGDCRIEDVPGVLLVVRNLDLAGLKAVERPR